MRRACWATASSDAGAFLRAGFEDREILRREREPGVFVHMERRSWSRRLRCFRSSPHNNVEISLR
jgi:hypothetical protein